MKKVSFALASVLALSFPDESVARPRQDRHEIKQARLAQYMTPTEVATFMAAQFTTPLPSSVRILDAGAGRGALSIAFIDRWKSLRRPSDNLSVSAFELDHEMIPLLQSGIRAASGREPVETRIVEGDFIAEAVKMIERGEAPFTHAILNPPYKKIGSQSEARLLLERAGAGTVNLYAGFVSLGIKLLEPGGQLVAIIPRSFCNGLYYRSFRDLILKETSIKAIHLFHSRDRAFAADGVLQETVIIVLKKGEKQADIRISTSTDATFDDISTQTHRFGEIVDPADLSRFIRIPEGGSNTGIAGKFNVSLSTLGVSISTGPVVDFRLRRHLRQMPGHDTVPLLYPLHFEGFVGRWPKPDGRKPNAIALNADTRRWLYPVGYYVVVRRLSSKEERRRIMASVVRPTDFPGATALGFENHLNVFHIARDGLTEELADGLTVYLNSMVVDRQFRKFNGSTQVNATDLRSLPYPSAAALQRLSEWLKRHPTPTQQEIDQAVEGVE